MKKCILVILFIVAVFEIGCAKRAGEIKSQQISASEYYGMDCQELRFQRTMVDRELVRASDEQNSKADRDALAALHPATYVLLLFGTDRENEISRLKGERATLSNLIYSQCQ